MTGVDNAGKLDFVRSIGADRVVDYAREDYTRSGERYDLVLDLAGFHTAFAYRAGPGPQRSLPLCRWFGPTLLSVLLVGPLLGRGAGRKVRVLVVRQSPADLVTVADLCRAGTIVPVIDRRFPLSEVPEAIRHLGEGRALGKLVITLA